MVALVLLTLAVHPGALGTGLTNGLAALHSANLKYFWIAGGCFLVSLIAGANEWRTTLQGCGAQLGTRGACTRYGVGSLVNTFAPMRLGDAVRVVLFSRTLPQDEGRALTTGGALGTIEVARAIVQALLVATAAAVGTLPLWPVAMLGGLASFLLATFYVLRRRHPWRRMERLLDASRGLARSPRRAAALLGWTAAASVARVIAATAIATSLGAPWSFETGLIITVAIDTATIVPLMPGNLGVASGAFALALHSTGVPLSTAVAAGLSFHAVEAATSIAFGAAGALALARFPTPAARRLVLGLTAGIFATLVAGGLGFSVLPSIV
jgi:uncharacterized membrane protein YbhN (UPF0104 family)